MLERQDYQGAKEAQIIQAYERVSVLANMHGTDFNGGGKKAVAVFNEGSEGRPAGCITISLFAGHIEGEAKIIYKNERANGGTERIEYSFRQDGSFEKRVLKDRSVNVGRIAKGRSALEEIYRVKRASEHEIGDINALLSSAEAELVKPQRDIPCEDGYYPIPTHPRHKHLIRVKRKPNRK